MRVKDTKSFITRAKKIHGSKFDYSLIEYMSSKTKIIIICKLHGSFEQTPNNHLTGYGCPSCANNKQKDTKTFIKEANLKHLNEFDYSQTIYKNAREPVKINCLKHGIFNQTPDNHLRGQKCPECKGAHISSSKVKTKEQFILEANKIHEKKYSYELAEYINYKSPVKIICSIHGIFEQKPAHHLQKKGCQLCGGTKPVSAEEFIERANSIHNKKYSYQMSDYVNLTSHINIICPIHGKVKQKASNHLQGKGCKYCVGKSRDNTLFIVKANAIHSKMYTYERSNYTGVNAQIVVTCKKHGDFMITPRAFFQGSGCHTCAKFGFNPAKSAYLYYIKINRDGQSVYKIGATNLSVEERFKNESNLTFELIFKKHYKLGSDALKKEKYYLEKFKSLKYSGEKVLKAGNSELFKEDIFKGKIPS